MLKTKWKWVTVVASAIVVAGIVFWFSLDSSVRYLILHQPAGDNPMMWDTKQRDAAFQSIENIGVLPFRVIENGSSVHEFNTSKQLNIEEDKVNQYFEDLRIAGLVVLHDGDLVFERYALGLNKDRKWTSFSVAKSFTSILVGAAIKDGYIKSLDDKVSDYIPNLVGSHYQNVTIEQLLTMTSGAQWDEDYDDPNSDVNRFNYVEPDEGFDATVSYLRKLPTAHEPGTHWSYSTGETNLIGVLISKATGMPLADYLSEKIWKKIGAQHEASWLLGPTDHEISGCCIQATTRDFALYGQFIATGAKIAGQSILPEGYLQNATTKQADIGSETAGYGYQWWTFNDGTFHGRGIFGQGIFIDPSRKLVIAVNGNWPKATTDALYQSKLDLYHDIQSLVDEQFLGTVD